MIFVPIFILLITASGSLTTHNLLAITLVLRQFAISFVPDVKSCIVDIRLKFNVYDDQISRKTS